MKLERLRTRLLLLSSVSILPIFLSNQSAEAACILAPTAGNDNFVCDSGTGGPLNDTSGNDMLTLPTGGTGTITGPVNLGSGADTVIISSGTINGNLNTGAGNDRVELNDGIVNGTILQNSRADTFTMTGGQIGEVNLSTQIARCACPGAPSTGSSSLRKGETCWSCRAVQSAPLSISVSATTGFSSRRFDWEHVTTGTGNGQFTWNTAGTIGGALNLGGGTDTGTLENLTDAVLGSTPSLNGGAGTDTMIFANTTATTAGRYVNWENVALTSSSAFTLEQFHAGGQRHRHG